MNFHQWQVVGFSPYARIRQGDIGPALHMPYTGTSLERLKRDLVAAARERGVTYRCRWTGKELRPTIDNKVGFLLQAASGSQRVVVAIWDLMIYIIPVVANYNFPEE